jgi:hypothetical protein
MRTPLSQLATPRTDSSQSESHMAREPRPAIGARRIGSGLFSTTAVADQRTAVLVQVQEGEDQDEVHGAPFGGRVRARRGVRLALGGSRVGGDVLLEGSARLVGDGLRDHPRGVLRLVRASVIPTKVCAKHLRRNTQLLGERLRSVRDCLCHVVHLLRCVVVHVRTLSDTRVRVNTSASEFTNSLQTRSFDGKALKIRTMHTRNDSESESLNAASIRHDTPCPHVKEESRTFLCVRERSEKTVPLFSILRPRTEVS